MPMVGHQHKGQNAHRAFVERLGEHARESCIIDRLFKQRQAGYRSIEDMVHDASRGLSRAAGHGLILDVASAFSRKTISPHFACFTV